MFPWTITRLRSVGRRCSYSIAHSFPDATRTEVTRAAAAGGHVPIDHVVQAYTSRASLGPRRYQTEAPQATVDNDES